MKKERNCGLVDHSQLIIQLHHQNDNKNEKQDVVVI